VWEEKDIAFQKICGLPPTGYFTTTLRATDRAGQVSFADHTMKATQIA